MEKQYYVQKLNHDGSPLGEPRPLYADREQQPPLSQRTTMEGAEAVAAALGLKRVVEGPDLLDSLPPDERLAMGLQRLVEGQ